MKKQQLKKAQKALGKTDLAQNSKFKRIFSTHKVTEDVKVTEDDKRPHKRQKTIEI